jgi:surface antigen
LECWEISDGAALVRSGTAEDRSHASTSCQSALERNKDGQTTAWYVAGTSTAGQVSPLSSYEIEGLICREYSVSVGQVTGVVLKTDDATGTACRISGRWWAWPTAIPKPVSSRTNGTVK